ncbi:MULTISPECIES: L,D-transpeptidase family protein [Arcobacteraceae]|uniref:L,D-transpeptidase family protein n=1 Tax=Arcobacteraceae TaxID=2808963 RepID=UPI001D1747D9|nr:MULTISPECIES: L,D-transpeptidase family protein [Arcobacteraceae]
MNKIIILLCMVINIFANDLVNLYRLQGLSAVEKQLEDSLKDKKYWDNYLENKNVDLGYYETKKYVILTHKEKSELELYEINDNQSSLITRNSVIVGEKEGDKYLEGDKKTPEGVYELTSKKTNLDQFYGPLALVTSYPNRFDRTLDKKGYGIWIHGMPLKNEEREKYTRGCIALDNPELEKLDKNIDLDNALLLTSDKEFEKAKKEEISLILSSIFKWKDSWKKSDIKSYLKYYSPEFKKDDGSDFQKFSRYKKRIFSKRERKKIRFSNISITPYPNSLNKRMFKILMDQKYVSPTVNFNGKKELFLEIVNNEVKILVEG